MEEIKLFEGINVTINGETEFCESPSRVWELLNMKGDEWKEYQIEVLRGLIAAPTNTLDLSAAYKGISVLLAIVPCKD